MRPPSCRMLAWTLGSLVCSRMRPAPSVPRRKSTLSIAQPLESAPPAELAAEAAAAAVAACPRPRVTYTTLPSARVEYGSMRSRLNTTRVRPEASAATIESTPPAFTSTRRDSSATVVPGRSTARRAGLSMAKATGCGAGPSSTRRTSSCSPGCGCSSTLVSRLCAWAKAACAANASTPASATSAAGLAARPGRCAPVRRLFTCDDAAVILGSPCRSFAQCECGGAFDESAHAVWNDLGERDLAILDGRDPAVVLPDMIAGQDAVDQAVPGLHEAEDPALQFQRADHAQRVERELLEELARSLGIGPDAVGCHRRRDAGFERRPQVHRGVCKSLVRLHFGQRLDAAARPGLHLVDLRAHLVHVARAAGQRGQAHCGEDDASCRCHLKLASAMVAPQPFAGFFLGPFLALPLCSS